MCLTSYGVALFQDCTVSQIEWIAQMISLEMNNDEYNFIWSICLFCISKLYEYMLTVNQNSEAVCKMK